MDKEKYLEMLQRPSRRARVKTRWWWYGCRVKEEEIRFQLDEMQRAGIGGVELQITYPLQAGDDNYAWFSPDYFRILQFTSAELKKRDMTLDLTLGSSWPFGGPFVPFAKSAVHVIPLELSVEGPAAFSYDFTNRVTGEIIGCVMGQMDGCEMIPESIRDISGYLRDKLLYNWPWGTQLRDVPVPEGIWKIVIFAASQFREHVLMPTRGAEGYVIDHNNREAMRFFLEHAGTPLVEKLGRGAVENFFCDSLEVFGNNWAIGLYDEFEARRGYSLRPYIYALWGQVKGLTDRIRYDFHKTLSELTVEGFFREMTTWCHEMGSASRIQAHGTWGDVLLAYAAADVPEGETFSAWDKFSVNTVHRRLASSAGHLYGRPVISNESFTWLRFPRFCVTLEQIKIAADSIFMDGINQIVNHGYSYSPREKNTLPDGTPAFRGDAAAGPAGSAAQTGAEEPLYFYAATNISHTNTWWKYYPHIAAYINRVSAFLQLGEPAAQLCIYLPQADIWAENPLSDLHMCMRLEERIETAAVDAIAHAGYWFDYINDDAIADGKLDRYEALIIMGTERMPGLTARKIRDYALRPGRLVICAGKCPSKDCGMDGSFDVAGLFRELTASGLVHRTEDRYGSMLRFLRQNLVPYLSCGEGQGDIGYVRRVLDEEADLYFTANMSLRDHRTRLTLRERYDALLLLDPLTGEELPSSGILRMAQMIDSPASGSSSENRNCPEDNPEPANRNCPVSGTWLNLHFPPGQSYLLILRKEGRENFGEEIRRPAGSPECPGCRSGITREDGRVLPPLQRFYGFYDFPAAEGEGGLMPAPDGNGNLPAAREIKESGTGRAGVGKPGIGKPGIIDLSGDWELEVPELGFRTRLAALEGFEKIPRLRYYSGEVIYRKELRLSAGSLEGSRVLLQAEELGCCARVRINGKTVTDWIMRPYLADLTGVVRPGSQILEIAVSNLLINRFLDPDRKIAAYADRIMDQWPYFPQQLIKERGKRLDAWREKELVREPVLSGLAGAVRILIMSGS